MADRHAVLVDAGYFSAAGALLMAGEPKRALISFDFARLRVALVEAGRDHSDKGSRLLRIYWYDGAPSAQPTSWHNALGDLQDVKVRLGHLRGGRQKGVDTRIVLDLVRLAERRAVDEVVLIAGDEDLREGVAYVQECGVRVHLITFEGSHHSSTLIQEADTWISYSTSFFETFSSPKIPSEGTADKPS